MRVAKWGNSLAIRLPAAVVSTLGLEEGDEVEVRPVGEKAIEVAKEPTVEERFERVRRMREELKDRLPEGYRFKRADAYER